MPPQAQSPKHDPRPILKPQDYRTVGTNPLLGGEQNQLTRVRFASRLSILVFPANARLKSRFTSRFRWHASHCSVSGGCETGRQFIATYDHSTPARSSSSDPESATAD